MNPPIVSCRNIARTVLLSSLLCALPGVRADTLVSGMIDASTTWDLGGSPYVLDNDVTVVGTGPDDPAVVLTIEAGVEVQLGERVLLIIDNDAALVVNGTADNQVLFTRSGGSNWGSVRFDGSARTGDSTISNAVFEHGGATDFKPALLNIYAPTVETPVAVSHCTFRDSSTFGVVVDSGYGVHGGWDAQIVLTECDFENNAEGHLDLTQVAACTINSCHFGENPTGVAVRLRNAAYLPTWDGNSTAAAGQAIHLSHAAGTSQPIRETTTMQVPGTIIDTADPIPYRLHFVVLTHETGMTLTIEPGTTIQAGAGNRLAIDDNVALRVLGTAEKPVLFTRTPEAAAEDAYWETVHITDGANTANCLIEHAIFEYGGGHYDWGMIEINAPTVGAPTQIRNCTFRNSIASGLRVDSGYGAHGGWDAQAVISECRFENNASRGIWLRQAAPTWIDSCTFNGMGDKIAVGLLNTRLPVWDGNNVADSDHFVEMNTVRVPEDGERFSVPGTLANGDPIPYIPQNVHNFEEDHDITVAIDEGVVFQMGPGAGLQFGNQAAVHVNGTLCNPVLFTRTPAAEDAGEYWDSIYIEDGARTGDCQIDYAIFEYGGGSYDNRGLVTINAPTVDSPTKIRNCIFRNSFYQGLVIDSGYGMHGGWDAQAIIADCQFIDNAARGIWLRQTAECSIGRCSFGGNGEKIAVGLLSATPPVWGEGNTAAADHFVELDSIHIESEATLGVPGAVNGAATVIPYVFNHFGIGGTEENHITLSIDAGNVLQAESSGDFDVADYAALRLLGTPASPVLFTRTPAAAAEQRQWDDLEFTANFLTDQSLIQHAIFEYGGARGYGILHVREADFSVSNCVFRDSSSMGLNYDGSDVGRLTVANCEFRNNATDGIEVVNVGEGCTVTGCSFEGNGEYGLQNRPWGDPVSVDARNNDWGHFSGPLDDSDAEDTNFAQAATYHNPGGQGDAVSDDVLYDPWVGQNDYVVLTLAVAECHAGMTFPPLGPRHVAKDVPVTIYAGPACGQVFDSWSVGRTVDIADPTAAETTVTLTEDATVTAHFTPDTTDSDDDGLYDAWEQRIVDADPDDAIHTVNDVRPEDDFDRDGYSNLAEHNGETDPIVPCDPAEMRFVLQYGWNLIGIRFDCVIPDHAAIAPPFWGFHGTQYFDAAEENLDALWHVPGHLIRDRGYWIFCTENEAELIVTP